MFITTEPMVISRAIAVFITTEPMVICTAIVVFIDMDPTIIVKTKKTRYINVNLSI